MARRSMPAAHHRRTQSGLRFDLAPKALGMWNPTIRAAVEDDTTIGIFDVIGEDYWTGEGVTDKRIAAALRAIGDRDVTVNINSPGGDMFTGMSIYNLLREHPGRVTVKVLGVAASAASIIAMAGDVVQVARAGFLMIHNAWIYAAGNRHDFREFADYLEPFDASMADIYAARTGEEVKVIQKLMDAESWIGGSAAVDQGFADSLLPSDQIEEGDEKPAAFAVRRVENALRASGMPRTEAMRLISEFKATLRDAGGNGERDATPDGKAIKLKAEPLPKLSFPFSH